MIFNCALLFVSTYSVTSSAEITNDDLKKFADATNNLAGSLYPKLADGNYKNVLFNPLSLITGLGIMLYGAKGKTQEELYSILGYEAAGLPLDKVPEINKYYFNNLLPENNPDQVNYTDFCADEVLVTTEAPLKPDFQENAQYLYESTVKNVDFSQANVVTKNINKFVRRRTYGKIKHFVNDVNASSSSLVIDAVYFKGKWETPPQPQRTLRRPFYTRTGTKDVLSMIFKCSFPYYENNEFQAVFLPYTGGNVGFLILLPQNPYGLSAMEKSMTPEKIVSVLDQLQPKTTVVQLPKLKFRYYRDFSQDFYSLGAKTVFDGTGDFSGMTDSDSLSVSGVLHKAVLKVDESSSGNGDNKDDSSTSVPSLVLANHPFMFAIVDIRINLLFSLGRVIEV